MAGGLVQFRVLRNLVILSYANSGALWENVALTDISYRKVKFIYPNQRLCESRTF